MTSITAELREVSDILLKHQIKEQMRMNFKELKFKQKWYVLSLELLLLNDILAVRIISVWLFETTIMALYLAQINKKHLHFKIIKRSNMREKSTRKININYFPFSTQISNTTELSSRFFENIRPSISAMLCYLNQHEEKRGNLMEKMAV